MLLWFCILAPVLVAEIFRSPMIDYRMVALGALLPLLEVVTGGARVLHTLLGSVVVLTAVMLLTQNRRLVRRRWLGLPIGLFFHSVLDASWDSASLFWWPAFGFSFDGAPVPEFSRPLWISLGLELVALAVGWWAYRRYGLDDPDHRRRLLTTGQLDRGALPS